MLSKKIEGALNGQIAIEAMSSQAYLAMASWAENQGLSGTAAFLYKHSDEERMHMLKLVKDYTTHNFMQWYVSEQIEEEALARTLIDKLNLIGSDKGGLYIFDRDLEAMPAASATK